MEGGGRPRPFQTLQLKPDGRDSSVIPVKLQQNLLANNGRRSWLGIHETLIQFVLELDHVTLQIDVTALLCSRAARHANQWNGHCDMPGWTIRVPISSESVALRRGLLARGRAVRRSCVRLYRAPPP